VSVREFSGIFVNCREFPNFFKEHVPNVFWGAGYKFVQVFCL